MEPWARAQPHDLGAEMGLLGRILLHHDARRLLRDLRLDPGAYYRPGHETIHRAMLDLAEDGEPIDPITLTAALQRSGACSASAASATCTPWSRSAPTP